MQIDVAIRFNESESEQVASLLKLFKVYPTSTHSSTPEPAEGSAVESPILSSFAQFLESPSFRAEGDVLARFKRILAWLYSDYPELFDTMVEEYVLSVTGRICLGRSEAEVNGSGTNVKAQQILNTPYWVETNSDTAKKRRHLREWMAGLARDDAEIELAVAAIGDSKPRR